MIKIKQLRVRAVRVPMPDPHQTASGAVSESPLVLTDVIADEGTVGHSVVFTYTTAALEPTARLVQNMAAAVVGEPLAPLDVEHKLARRFRLLGTQGLVGMALAAIDMALWDALARIAGHLAGRACSAASSKPVRAPTARSATTARRGRREVAEAWASRGFTGVKAKIGYPDVAEDVAVDPRDPRGALGDRVAIMVDYNQASRPPKPCGRIRVLDDEGLDMGRGADDGARFRRPRGDRAGGANADPVRRELVGRAGHAACDRRARRPTYMMPDVMKIGGVTGWLRAAALAEPRGIRLSNHLWPEISAQLLSVTPTAHWLEYADWWNAVVKEPLTVKDGVATGFGSSAGSGVEWNEAAIAKVLV